MLLVASKFVDKLPPVTLEQQGPEPALGPVGTGRQNLTALGVQGN